MWVCADGAISAILTRLGLAALNVPQPPPCPIVLSLLDIAEAKILRNPWCYQGSRSDSVPDGASTVFQPITNGKKRKRKKTRRKQSIPTDRVFSVRFQKVEVITM